MSGGLDNECSQPFLGYAGFCYLGKAYKFKHVGVPNGFTQNSPVKVKEFVHSSKGLSFHLSIKFEDNSPVTAEVRLTTYMSVEN